MLYGILAFYKFRHPDQPVFAYRDTLLAETLLDSRTSLYRGLQEAEDKGYLRRDQVRTWGAHCYGQFSRSHIFLMDKALVMLGLEPPKKVWEAPMASDPVRPLITPAEAIEAWENTCVASQAHAQAWQDDASRWETCITQLEAEAPADAEADPVSEPDPVATTYPQGPCPPVVHGLQESERTLELQLKEQLPTPANSPEAPPVKDSFKNVDPKTRLPEDVRPLMQLGVSKTLICTLMAYAKRQGQAGQLGAAVKLFWQHIEGLRGRSVFAYLRTVLSRKRDYAHLLKQQHADEIDGVLTGHATARLTEKLAQLLSRCDGFQVRNAEGAVIGTLRSNGATGHVDGFDPKRGRFAMPANLRFMRAVEEGRLHLRPC